MGKSIFYAEEYPVSLERVFPKEHILTTARTVAEAKECMEVGGVFDGYILGCVMIRDGYVGQVDDLTMQGAQIRNRLRVTRKEAVRNELNESLELIDTAIAPLLNYRGGNEVFEYLQESGIVGTRPILWFTSQTKTDNGLIVPDKERLIRVAKTVVSSNYLRRLIDRI